MRINSEQFWYQKPNLCIDVCKKALAHRSPFPIFWWFSSFNFLKKEGISISWHFQLLLSWNKAKYCKNTKDDQQNLQFLVFFNVLYKISWQHYFIKFVWKILKYVNVMKNVAQASCPIVEPNKVNMSCTFPLSF